MEEAKLEEELEEAYRTRVHEHLEWADRVAPLHREVLGPATQDA